MKELKVKIVARCCVCQHQMCEGEAWLPENTKDSKVYCFSHAPADAIRLKDTIKPLTRL